MNLKVSPIFRPISGLCFFIFMMISIVQVSAQSEFGVMTILTEPEATIQYFYSSRNIEPVLQKVHAKLGSPASDSESITLWKGLEIPGIGENLELKLIKGVFTLHTDKGKNRGQFVPYKSKGKKKKANPQKETPLTENQNQQVFFIINNEKGENIITEAYNDMASQYVKELIY